MKIKRSVSFLIWLLCLVLLAGLLPAMNTNASAAGSGKAIVLAGGAAPNIAGAQESQVYFGSYQQTSDGSGGFNTDPIKWRVLQNDAGKLFLLADQNLDAMLYHMDRGSVTWAESTIRSWLNGYGASENKSGRDYSGENFIGSAFSTKEQAAIAKSVLKNPDNDRFNPPTPGGSVTTDQIFLLSAPDAANSSYGFTNDYSRKSTNTSYVAASGSGMEAAGGPDCWWLRSPGHWNDTAAYVKKDGSIASSGDAAATFIYTVRPACCIDLNAVLFTSAASGGKAETLGTLSAVGDYSGSEWKLTLLDSTKSDFSASYSGRNGNLVTVNYSGARASWSAYISALITNASGAVTYYGKVRRCRSASGSVSFDIGGKLNAGDTLYVFNESCAVDYKTDYASPLCEITIPGSVTDLTPGDVNGDGTVNAKDIALLQRFVAKWEVTMDESAADVNADGEINAKDIALLQRYVAGWSVVLK